MSFIQKVRHLFRRPIKRRYVFVVTYGRSGSTLLMNLINSCEGCCIRGENNSALHGLYESYRRIVDAQQGHGKNAHRTSSPWWGITSVDADRYARRLAEAFIDEVIMPGQEDTLCGFKEIRFSRREVPDLHGYLEFIAKFFPGAKFVFNHRSLDDVATSKWWAGMPNALDLLRDMDERFSEFKPSPSMFHFSYDEALKHTGHVRDLFEFLNITYDEKSIQQVFSQRHSY